MYPIRSSNRQQGLTLVELLIVIMLSLVVILGAGTLYNSVDRTYKLGTHKVIGGQEASLLSTVISRRVRVASGFQIYDVSDPTTTADAGNGIALLDAGGNVTYRLEWDILNSTLTDSTGARLTAMDLQNLQFSVDPTSATTVRYRYQTIDGEGHPVSIESAAALRN